MPFRQQFSNPPVYKIQKRMTSFYQVLVILLVASSQLVTNGTPISQDLSAALMKAAPPSPVAANAADVQKSNATKSSSGAGSTLWSYDDPDAWVQPYKECGGWYQSPISIDPAAATYINYPKFVFGNYDKLAPMNITNNGHSVLLHLPDDYPEDKLPYITGGGLDGRYNFVQLHFHWGSDPSQGSEHNVQFRSYPAELHIVHYNTKYKSFPEATTHNDGLAVLGILMEMLPMDNVALRHIVEQFPQILVEGLETNLVSPIPLQDLLPDNLDNFYRYNGSLTTPGCQEIVIWTVFDTPIGVSQHQLSNFRLLIDPEGHQLVNNNRPPHFKHGRNVTFHSTDGKHLRHSVLGDLMSDVSQLTPFSDLASQKPAINQVPFAFQPIPNFRIGFN